MPHVPDVSELKSEQSKLKLNMILSEAATSIEKVSLYMKIHSLIKTLRYLNNDKTVFEMHKAYAQLLMIDEGNQEGLTWVSNYWYYRNMLIVKNIINLALL